MGELILCSHPLAAMPYYIDLFAVNVYSLEEISYCIEQNYCLLEEAFMEEELCAWVQEELSEKELGEALQAERESGDLAAFTETLLHASSYTPEETIQTICGQLRQMRDKSAYEIGKLRADRYVQNGKYTRALGMYRRLLQQEDCRKDPEKKGVILHNLGCVYARLFAFEEALNCFLQAYDISHREESLKAYRECTNFAEHPEVFPMGQEESTCTPEKLEEWIREYKEEQE